MSTMTPALDQAELHEERGFWSWITTTNHKKIGQLYIGTSLGFFLVGVVFAMLMRTQLIGPNQKLLTPEQYNQIFSMHGTTMVFLFGVPMLIGLANYLVPLQIGARDMAFPRLNAMSFWVLLFGGLLMYSSFLFGGALDAGWYGYAPLTEKAFAGSGITYWSLALLLVGISSLMGAVNFIVTMLKLRAPGMTWLRMPLFSISTFINSFLILFAIPALTADVALLYLDRHFGTVFFNAPRGGDPLIWAHLFWFFGHPEVYILILPAFGIMSEVVPVFSRKPLFGRTTMVIMLVAIGFLGFGVWGHHMFTVGMPTAANSTFAGVTMLIAIPTGVKIFNWLATMWGGSLKFKTPLYFACGLIALFTVGGITGVTLAVVPFDTQVHTSYYVVAHLHNVLFPGTVFAVFAGFYYWFPKVTGRFFSDRLGKWHFWTLLFGFMFTFIPMYILGFLGMPRRVFTYSANLGWDTLNLISTLGAYLIAVSVVIFLVNLVRSMRSPRRAPANPWGAWTLEWATSSPPPSYNFDTLPPVTSDRPLYDLGQPAEPLAIVPDEGIEVYARPAPAQPAGAAHAAPPPEISTALPFLGAVALLAVVAGLIHATVASIAAAVVLLAVAGAWMWVQWPEPDKPPIPGERFSTMGAGMLTFLGSEVIFFGSLIFAYVHLRFYHDPVTAPHLSTLLPWINTVILLSSGAVASWARSNARKGKMDAFRLGLVGTVVLGAIFLGGQAWEYTHNGLHLAGNVVGSTFFTLTGFHGAHVTGGILLLGYLFIRTLRDKQLGVSRPGSATNGMIEAATYYWHFVDVVWVAIFVIVYLL